MAQMFLLIQAAKGRAQMELKNCSQAHGDETVARAKFERFSYYYILTADEREAGMREGGDRGREEGRRGKGKEGGRERQAEERGE